MRYRLLLTFVWIGLAHVSASSALAQSSITPLGEGLNAQPPSGWSLTPAIDYAFTWDSNVLFRGAVSEEVAEQVHVFTPRGVVAFVGRRGDINAEYLGSFAQHAQLSSLNSFDQRLTTNAIRHLNRRASLFVRHLAQAAPTTELLDLVGVPFMRVGSHRQEIRGGVQAKLTRNLETTAAYQFQWVDFKQDPDGNINEFLNGGHSHGGNVSLKHALGTRLWLTGDYDAQNASMVNGQRFTLQNSFGGVEYATSDVTRVFGAVGVSHLGSAGGRPSRLGPSVRVGMLRNVRDSNISVIYSRSYVPSYGFGGTTDNEDLTTRVQVPINRRLYAATGLAVRRNEPLDAEDLSLRSLWFQGSIGYLLADWMRVEAYSAGSRQNANRPGGRINRYQFGLQLSAATTARIR